MPPTRWRGGNGLPLRSNSIGCSVTVFESPFVAGFGEDLFPGDLVGFIGL
jgi:hypothetical protein